VVSDRNRAVSDERFEYRRCHVCGVIWLPAVPADIAGYYPPEYHAFLEGDALERAAAGESARLALITRHVTGGRLVEIGPSHGVFAYAARKAGFDVVGIEMDPACCAHLERVIGVRAINSDVPEEVLAGLPPSRAVVMFHVLEHVPDPWGVLRAVAANLEPGGVLALATPNPRSLQARVLRERWVHLDAPRHLTLMPLPAIEDEAAKLGLTLVDATTTDPTGLAVNSLGWERSLVRAPALAPKLRFAYWPGRLLTQLVRPFERRDLHGAAFTAVFRKAGA
jgi:SAM-dependent methyltransferase